MFCEVVPEAWRGGWWGIDPQRLCRSADESLALVEQLAGVHHRRGDGRTTVTPSPELPEMATAQGLRDAAALARRLGTVLPTHLCASPESRAAFGPPDLERLGLLDDRLLAAQCSAVDAADIVALGRGGIGVAHCPSAARALGATTFTPVDALRRAGARVGIGLDNASLHADTDLFAEARVAMRVALDAGAPLAPSAAFEMLTVDGARAIGMADQIGSIEPGKRADLLLLDAGAPHWRSFAGGWVEAVVRGARSSDVRATLVDGAVVHGGAARLRRG